ncbi:MAG: Arm DNA-binding domain-containing protein [Pseudomonadales bacterium]|jgi:hypothetical protein
MPLSVTAIKNAKPGDKPKRLYGERGLYLELAPGGGRWWRFKYRIDGKEKRLSLGVYPDIGLVEAREARDAARKQSHQNQRPQKSGWHRGQPTVPEPLNRFGLNV